MSTRCLTVFLSHGQEIAVMYRHCDGYPAGHGRELKDFLHTPVVKKEAYEFGMPAAAALVIGHFKKPGGVIYLYPPGTRGLGEEYIYYVTLGKRGAMKVRTEEGDYADEPETRNTMVTSLEV